MSQVIFHIDINAFFASAHLLSQPELKGKPVVVCSNRRQSVVTTASYEARNYGVQSAMPLEKAKKLCPKLEVVDLDFDLYQDLSSSFIEIIKSYSPYVEQASIDECYVEVGKIINEYNRPLDLAFDIQNRVYQELQLPCSIGIGPNKFLAKMASDMRKPMGVTVLRIREVKEKLWNLPIESMHGIGKKSVPKLKNIHIYTIGDLAQTSTEKISPILGKSSRNFINKANGIDQSPLEIQSDRQSMGQSKTYSSQLFDLDEIRQAFMIEIVELEKRLREKSLKGRTISISIRYDDFKTASRSQTFQDYIDDRYIIFERAMILFSEFEDLQSLSFLSVTLSNLKKSDEIVEQLDLFKSYDNQNDINIVIRRLNEHFDNNIFIKTKDLINGDE